MRFPTVLFAAWLASAATTGGCAPPQADASPAQVVQAFAERMRAVHGDPAKAQLAVDLVWQGARENLEERARRATAAAGQPVSPGEMLVPSMFALAFEPRTFTAEVRGDYARVTVLGRSSTEFAEVHCVREKGHWHVILELPALPPIQLREGAEPT
jgi:hypothetical protein